MVPPKKKRRVVVPMPKTNMDIAAVEGDCNASTIISRKDLLTKQLMVNLDSLESNGNGNGDVNGDDDASKSASIGLMKLKSLQRSVLEKMRKTQELLHEQATTRDQQELQLKNLRYQNAVHQKLQKGSDQAVEATSLEIARLVRRSRQRQSQTTAGTTEGESTGGDDADKDDELLQAFLGDDWKDPSRRHAIVAKLNHEVATRKTLKDELNKLKVDRTSKEESLASRQKLLKDLPSKVADMEKASLPLQKFCQKRSSSSSSLMKATPLLGTTKRRNRLDLAKSLPKALYTLFHQLQSCLDVMETATSADTIAPEALPSVEIQSAAAGNNEAAAGVLLKIPIPTLSPGAGGMSYKPKKQASIMFQYDATLEIVLAACGTDYDMGPGVIDELFPGDRGEFLWTKNVSPAQGHGRPYQWCNYLGGLHVSPVEQSASRMHSSARVIVRALVRRVRATATLSWIVHALSRKPSAPNFPKHPALQEEDKESNDHESTTKLSGWSAVNITDVKTDNGNGHDGSNQFIRVYKAILQRGNDGSSSTKKTLVAKVTINVARYPSSIPQWKLLSSPNEGHEDDEEVEEHSLDVLQGHEAPQQLPLYNEALARLEQDINQKVDQLVVSSDQNTYDWILAHQLVEITKGWEET
jgi:hypothetical protein